MNHLHCDIIGGASGDMLLGMFADMGLDIGEIANRLESLKLGKIELTPERCADRGLAGTRITVKINGHDAHNHHEHHHRRLADIKKILSASDLPDKVKTNGIRVFERLANAEAFVHGTTPDKIHFHEVGAADSIIDITGACFCLYRSGVENVSISVFPLGSGTTTCAHGIIPVPVPATVELLKGFGVRQTGEPFELVTPTGAALLTSWKNADSAPAGARIVGSGYGLGHRKLENLPNVVRGIKFECAAKNPALDFCRVLECNLDDMTPELVSILADSLMTQGALDVFITPVQMKKQRPGVQITVICREPDKSALLDIIFMESTTFGVREYEVERTILDRRHEWVETPYGRARVKIGSLRGEDITFSPEFDDCIALAGNASVTARKVYESVLAIANGAFRPGT